LTIVIRTRYGQKYYDYREVEDWGENIFLNKDIWNFDIEKIEDILASEKLFALPSKSYLTSTRIL
jgi:hypothetical protein